MSNFLFNKNTFLGWLLVGLFSVVAITIFIIAITAPWPLVADYQIAVPQTKTTTLIAVGDIMLARTVEQKMINHNDWLYPFRETADNTRQGDIVFGNLETPLIKGAVVEPYGMSFRADPTAVTGLQYAGFSILSLANNHLNNQGAEGIQTTITALNQAGIAHTGAGMNLDKAAQPAILTVNKTTFGFLAYTQSGFTPGAYQATDQRSGVYFMDTDKLIRDIEKLQNKVDIIVVSMHAGIEYSHQPSQEQITFAHTAIDHGATLVLGHHPHVLQPYEQYKHGYIFYSLGNFVFDQMWSEPTREGVIAKITFTNRDVTDIALIPIKIFEYAQPRLVPEINTLPTKQSF